MTARKPRPTFLPPDALMPAGGMAERVRAFDWASTPLGPVEGWPGALQIALGICLNSRFPMFVWWGPHQINIYNDAYVPMLGERHPAALGRPARDAWEDIWPIVGAQAETVMKRGEATWNERVKLVMHRHGYEEETWFTWSYSPIYVEDGTICGMFCAVTEETPRVLAERERDALLERAESERARLAEAFALSPSFLAVLRGPRHVFEFANERYLEVIGHRDVIGEAVRDAIPEVVDQGYLDVLDRVYASGEPFVGTGLRLALRREAGGPAEDVYLDFVYQPMHGPGGEVTGILVHGVDVTQRQREAMELARVERTLRESEARFRQLADAMPQIVFTATADGQVDYFNRRWYEYTGIADGETGTDSWKLVHTEEGLRRVMQAWPRALATGEPYEIEYPLRRRDGAYRWHLGRALPIRDASGAITRWFGTNTDIHDRRQIQETLAAEKRILEMIAHSVPHAEVLDAIARGVEAQSADGARCAIEGAEAGEPGDPHAHIPAAFHRAAAAPILAGDGEALATVALYYPTARAPSARDAELMRSAGHFAGIVLERSRQDQRLRQSLEAEQHARSEAELASRMKDEFLATLSHELRTPLNAILGWAYMLRQDVTAQQLAHGADVIERNARAQSRIIEDLLDMSAIISGKVRLDSEVVGAADVVRAAIETARPAAMAKQVRIDLDFGDAAMARIAGDRNRLQQVLWNLLSNAVKFTPREGRVAVRLSHPDASHVEILVSDSGEGIAPEFLPHVFDRFRQADASTTRRHGGLGLGLAIVKQLVELHGGTVFAASEGPGRGAAFTVRIPLAGGDSRAAPGDAEPAAATTARPASSLDGIRVLVVDDDGDARDLVKRLLEEHEALVTAASSSAEALEHLGRASFDVLVSDIGMPAEDGHALMRRVRELPPDRGGATPAIALTAYARPEDRIKAIRAGFHVHAAKPVDPVELVALVRDLGRR